MSFAKEMLKKKFKIIEMEDIKIVIFEKNMIYYGVLCDTLENLTVLDDLITKIHQMIMSYLIKKNVNIEAEIIYDNELNIVIEEVISTALSYELGSQKEIEIITFLKYRILFKQAYILAHSNLDEQKKEIVKDFENVNIRKEKEQEIEDALNIPYGHVIIDVPYMELHQSEPRIDKTDITIIDKNEKKSMDEFTPVARAVRSRKIPDWLVMIVTDEKYREVLSKKAEKMLFS